MIDTEIVELEEKFQKKNKFDGEKLKKLQNGAELLFSAYSKQSELSIEDRLKILKNFNAELL
jgi:hypothetical protein